MTENTNIRKIAIEKLSRYWIVVKLWRLFCLIQRRHKNIHYLKSHHIRKLHIGSGENVIKGWLNTDLTPYVGTEVIFLDATHKFPFGDNTFDYIFSEHMIEHVPYEKGIFVFRECYRVLKPGGIIRIATPNLHFLIDLFKQEKSDAQKWYIQRAIDNYFPQYNICSDTFVINNFFYNWGHQFIYDFDILAKTLGSVGFDRVTRCMSKKSEHDALQGLESHWTYKEFDDVETMVVEGEKVCKK